MRRATVLFAAVALAACTHDLPQVQIQKELVPVQQPCTTSDTLGPDPVYVDSAANLANVPHPDAVAQLKTNPADTLALMDELDNLAWKVKQLLAGRAQRIQRDKEKSAALAGCEGLAN